MSRIYGTEVKKYLKTFLHLPSLEPKDKSHYDCFIHGFTHNGENIIKNNIRGNNIRAIYQDTDYGYIPHYTLDTYISTVNWDFIHETIEKMILQHNKSMEVEYKDAYKLRHPCATFHHKSNIILNSADRIKSNVVPYVERTIEDCDCLMNCYTVSEFEELVVTEIPEYLESVKYWLNDRIDEIFQSINSIIEDKTTKPPLSTIDLSLSMDDANDIYGKKYYGIQVETQFNYNYNKIHSFVGKYSNGEEIGNYFGIPMEIIIEVRLLTRESDFDWTFNKVDEVV